MKKFFIAFKDSDGNLKIAIMENTNSMIAQTELTKIYPGHIDILTVSTATTIKPSGGYEVLVADLNFPQNQSLIGSV